MDNTLNQQQDATNVAATLHLKVDRLSGELNGLEWLTQNTIFQFAPVSDAPDEVMQTMRKVLPRFVSVSDNYGYDLAHALCWSANKAALKRLHTEFVTLALVRAPAKFSLVEAVCNSKYAVPASVAGSPHTVEVLDLLELADDKLPATTQGEALGYWCDTRKTHRTYLVWLTRDSVANAPRQKAYTPYYFGVLPHRDALLRDLQTAFVLGGTLKVGTLNLHVGGRKRSFHTLSTAVNTLLHNVLATSAPLALANKGITAYLCCGESNAPILNDYIPTDSFSDWLKLEKLLSSKVVSVAPPDSPIKTMRWTDQVQHCLDECVVSHDVLRTTWSSAMHQVQRAPKQPHSVTIMLPMV